MNNVPTHFVDFEASGIAPDSYPIEVAVIYPGGEYQCLIQPARYWDYWSYDAQDMHGLTREELVSNGLPPLQVAQVMNTIFDGHILCSDNPTDCFWSDVLYEAAGIEPTFSVRPLESFIGREAATQALVLRPAVAHHRALEDAKALASCVTKYINGVVTLLPTPPCRRDFGDTSRTYLSKLEGGRSSITLDKLDQVCQRLELSPLTLGALTLSEETGLPAAKLIAQARVEIDALSRDAGQQDQQIAMPDTTIRSLKSKSVPPQSLQTEFCFSASQ